MATDRTYAKKSITIRVLEWSPQATSIRDRPRGTWRRMKDKDVERRGKLWNDVKKLVQDRESWKVFVRGLYPGAGLVWQ